MNLFKGRTTYVWDALDVILNKLEYPALHVSAHTFIIII